MAAIADSTSFKTTGYGRDLARRLGLSGFGRWWAQELATLMPRRLRAALEHRRARPVLAFDAQHAVLWRPVRANGQVRMVEAARIPLDGDAQAVTAGGRSALAPLVHANGAAPEVVISLSPRASLRKRLVLPAAIESNLHQALAYDLDRHTPFKSDELYFDAVVVDRDAVHNTLHVELAAARRAIVDPMLRQAQNFGARVVGICVDPPAAAAASRLDLLPQDRSDAASSASRWQVVVPAALLVLGILAALVLPVWQKRDEAIELNAQSEQARQRAGVSDALRTELERRVGDYNFALERKYAFPGTVQVLDDITRILPDDTWLTQLELRAVRGKEGQRELALRGESANAGRLVSLLEDSKLFTQAAPRSPTTKIQPGPGEIFDVGAQLKPLPAQVPAPIDMSAPPVPRVPPPAANAPAPRVQAPGASAPVPAGGASSTAPGPTAAPAPAPPAAGATTQAPAARPTARNAGNPPRATPAPANPGATGPAAALPGTGQPPAPAGPPPATDAEPAEGEGNPQ